MASVPYIEYAVERTLKRSNLASEQTKYILMRRQSKFIGFVGDWGVGKDSLALKILDKDIPDPKEEQNHPFVQSGFTCHIRNLRSDPDYFLTLRIIPGKYRYREREENFFDSIHPGHYDFDALVFCFSLNCGVSFYNLGRKWIPKARIALGHKMPFCMVVGTKSDLPVVAITEEQEEYLENASELMYYSRSSVRDNSNIDRIRNMLLAILSHQKPDD